MDTLNWNTNLGQDELSNLKILPKPLEVLNKDVNFLSLALLRKNILKNENCIKDAVNYAARCSDWFPFGYLLKNSKSTQFSLYVDVKTIVVLLTSFEEDTSKQKLFELLDCDATLIYNRKKSPNLGSIEPEDYIRHYITPTR